MHDVENIIANWETIQNTLQAKGIHIFHILNKGWPALASNYKSYRQMVLCSEKETHPVD